MQRKLIHLFGFLLILTISIGFIENPFTSSFVDQMKDADVTVIKKQDPLYEEIIEKAKEYQVPAVNAEIHKVWKATPGYNGLQVDVEASYKKMQAKGTFNEDLLVFRQVKPSIHFEDLEASPMYRGNPDKPMVSFLINVAWGNEYIPDMLETLNKYHVKATFFLEGRWAKENPDMAKMIVEAGHEVGNHSYSHPDMSKLSAADIREQLSKTNDVLKSVTDTTPTWFAPPSGSMRDEVVTIADEMQMKTVMWSVDTIDWQRPEPHVLVERVMSKVHNGALILMHPTSSTSESLETLIISIRNKGYSFGSLSMMINEERLSTTNTKSDN
ncbi:polysaccharide deacetylase family protein [Metabacillus sp. HB246100]|uniref:polysaccharide deacetylase family protein n=1 Tax=Bacillus weihaiensis TaxID=1547283 RepID=UPI002353390A|nr:polysaccharide deacetylase family protein [Bacillus weihaiensis]